MKVIRHPAQLRRQIQAYKRAGKRIGFIPTMGALHEGHASLIRRAREEADRVVVSIFVNPIQFDRPKDLRSYPRPLQNDIRVCSRAGADLIFIPSAAAVYPPGFQTTVNVTLLSRRWEGACRPGHFQGVATVVTKLFNLVQPDLAYFGEKDAQQARIVRQLIRDLDFDITLRVLPTARDRRGVAVSSRNRLLPPTALRRAVVLHEALQDGRRLIKWGERRGALVVRRMKARIREVPGSRIDYAAVVDRETFEPLNWIDRACYLLLAVRLGPVRLIDCCPVEPLRKRFGRRS